MSVNLTAISKLEKNPKEIYEEARRLLIKIADNVLKDPHNEKLRILQKSNATISVKVLGAYGGLDCLLLMGFQDNETFLKLPTDAPLDSVEQMRNDILQYKGPANIENVNAKSDANGPSRGAVPKHSKLTLSTHTLGDDLEGSLCATENDHLLSYDTVLIDHVKERPPLWNNSLPASQRTEEIQNALWQEISDAIKNIDFVGSWEMPALKKRWQLICKIYETSDVLSLAEKSMWKCAIEKCKFLITEEINEFACHDEQLMQAREDIPKQLSACKVDAQKSECTDENTVNPVCIRLSEILDELPLAKRAKLEVEFLVMAYDSLLREQQQ